MIPILRVRYLIVLLLLLTVVTPAIAAPDATVRLTVLRITDINDDADSLSEADFYVAGTFSYGIGQPTSFNNEDKRIEGEVEIHPNWMFEFNAPLSAARATLELKVFDFDSGLNFGDDAVVKNTLNIEFGLCRIALASSPTVFTPCGRDLRIRDIDEIVVRVEVLLPPSAPGLRVRCLQDPLLPVPGERVTVRAEALDGNAAPKLVDHIAIDINDDRVLQERNVAQIIYQFTMKDLRFRLRCVAVHSQSASADLDKLFGGTAPSDLETADTRPREVRRGTSDERVSLIAGPADSRSAIDIFIMPLKDYLGLRRTPGIEAWFDPAFLNDLRTNLLPPPGFGGSPRRTYGFYDNPYILSIQHRINFWILHREARGSLPTMPENEACKSMSPPEDWDHFPQAEAGWIFWDPDATAVKDCSRPSMRYFTADSRDATSAVHEAGHVPVGLKDEYDGAPYATYNPGPGPDPNVFPSLTACSLDAATFGAFPADCRRIRSEEAMGLLPDLTKIWFTHDPPANQDVMGNDKRTFNRLDVRRWQTLVNRCATGGC
jgi:hypothetical protein